MVNFRDFRISGFQELGNLEIVLILKEREGYNLGDGKFSGFPEGGYLEMMARRWTILNTRDSEERDASHFEIVQILKERKSFLM